jgi:hypothetical protein
MKNDDAIRGTWVTRVNRCWVGILLFPAVYFCCPVLGRAQALPSQSTYRKIEFSGLVGVGYPTALTGGFGVVIGSERAINGRYTNRRFKGISANLEAGPGGVIGRLGWTSLFRYDAGAEGLSFEAVYMRPWMFKWGVERNRNWVGPGVTYRIGYARISGAAMFKTGTGSWQIAPSATVGLVFPLH